MAPSASAVSRLNSTGSTAITWVAPACDAPCTALMPMPPMPMMMTVWPGRTSAAFTAEPQPVPTPQPTRQAFSSGMSLSTFTHEATSTTVSSQNVEMPAPWPIGWPSMRHPEAAVGPAARSSTLAPRSHRFCMPGRAPAAAPAAGQERQHDVVADLPAGRVRADLGRRCRRPRGRRPSAGCRAAGRRWPCGRRSGRAPTPPF